MPRKRSDAVSIGDGLGHFNHDLDYITKLIDERDWVLLSELLMCPDEQGLLQALWENPDDDDTRGAYADFLKEKGRIQTARLIASGWTPGQRMRTY